jgi:parvulin-like peptidyl-prolyl isomerase
MFQKLDRFRWPENAILIDRSNGHAVTSTTYVAPFPNGSINYSRSLYLIFAELDTSGRRSDTRGRIGRFTHEEMSVKLKLAALLIGAALASGCNSDSQPPADSDLAPQNSAGPTVSKSHDSGDEVIADVNGREITLHELQGPLMEAYGLNVLLQLVELDLVEQAAAHQSVTVSDQDVEDETVRTLIEFRAASHQDELASSDTQPSTEPTPSDDTLSPVEEKRQLTLLLTGQRLTEAEFKLAMRRNALLRKMLAPQVEADMTEEHLRDRFNAIYGEKARVRFIRLTDMLAVAKVEQELKAGHSFEEETRLHAYDSIGRSSSGELEPFSRKDLSYPPEFKMVAFALKPGQVSDPLQIKDSIYLVQLIGLIAPRHANFEDYRDSVRKDFYEQEMRAGVRQYLQSLGTLARQTLEIRDPVLMQQWQVHLRDAGELKQQLQQDQAAATTQQAADAPEPATAPAN